MKNNITLFKNKIARGLGYSFLFAFSLLLTTLTSCSDENRVSGGKSSVGISFSVASPEQVTRSAATSSTQENATTNLVQDGSMFFETSQGLATSSTTRANSLATGVKVRLVIYKGANLSSAVYVGYQDYTTTSGGAATFNGSYDAATATTSPTQLLYVNQGDAYCFVAYSTNNGSIPAISASGTVDASPANSDDFLYYKEEGTTISSQLYNVHVVFKHLFALTTVTMDVAQMALNLTSLSANLPNTQVATINLKDTTSATGITYGTTRATPLTFTPTSGYYTNAASSWKATSNTVCVIQATTSSTQVKILTMAETTPNQSYVPTNPIITTSTTALAKGKLNSIIIYPKHFMDMIAFPPVPFTYADGSTIYFAQGNLIRIGTSYGFNYRPEAYTGRNSGGDYWRDFIWSNYTSPSPIQYYSLPSPLKAAGPGASYGTKDPCANLAPWNGKSWHTVYAFSVTGAASSPSANSDDGFGLFTSPAATTSTPNYPTTAKYGYVRATRNGNSGIYFGDISDPGTVIAAQSGHLFMPYAGYRVAAGVSDTNPAMSEVGTAGYYWSTGAAELTPWSTSTYNNYYINFSASTTPNTDNYQLYTNNAVGYAIRCVAY